MAITDMYGDPDFGGGAAEVQSTASCEADKKDERITKLEALVASMPTIQSDAAYVHKKPVCT